MTGTTVAAGAGRGAARITASYSGATGSAVITVLDADCLMSIEVRPATAVICAGQTETFSAVGVEASARMLDLTDTAVRAAEPDAVATIDPAGPATGIAVGTATVTAAAGDVSGTATLTVTSGMPENLVVVPAATTLRVGGSVGVTATIDVCGETMDATASVAWDSSDPAIATVSAGSIFGVSAGVAAIRATTGILSATSVVTVEE